MYPEESGLELNEARAARRWREEVDATLAAPMARAPNGKDLYVGEAAMVKLDAAGDDISPVVIMRWFQQTDGDRQVTYAKVHPLRFAEQDARGYVVDGRDACENVPLERFLLSVVDMLDPATQVRYRIPSPENISGMYMMS